MMRKRAPVAVAALLGLMVGLLITSASASGAMGPEAQAPTATPTRQPTGSPTPVVTPATPAPATAPRDCGSDLACLIEASRSCQLAAGTSTQSFSLFGILVTSSARLEIRGGVGDTCTLYYVVVDLRVRFTEGLRQSLRDSGQTEAQIQEAEAESNRTVVQARGLDLTCNFPRTELTALLTRWAEGGFSSDDLTPRACSGSFFTSPAGPSLGIPSGPRIPSGPPPSNDDFESAEVMSVPGSATGDSSNATAEPEEMRPCGMERATVWFAATPDQAGVLTAVTSGSSFDTVLAIYTGSSLEDLTLVDCNDDGPNDNTSEIRVPVTADTTYYIQLGSWSSFTAGGPYLLDLRLDP